MRFAHSVALFALLASPLAAMADTVTFGSVVGTVSYSNSFYTPSSGEAVQYTLTDPYSIASYPTPVAGTVYLAYNDTTEAQPAGYTTYSQTVNGEGGGSGSLMFVADNSVIVYLNNVEIGSSDSFSAMTTANFTLAAGTNTFTYVVYNTPFGTDGVTPNPTALDFGGTATVAATPEPSSMMLLGTGLLAVAGLGRRKLARS